MSRARHRGRRPALSPWWARALAAALSSGALFVGANATLMAGKAISDVEALKANRPRVEERLRAVETGLAEVSMSVNDSRRAARDDAADLRRRLERIEAMLMKGQP